MYRSHLGGYMSLAHYKLTRYASPVPGRSWMTCQGNSETFSRVIIFYSMPWMQRYIAWHLIDFLGRVSILLQHAVALKRLLAVATMKYPAGSPMFIWMPWHKGDWYNVPWQKELHMPWHIWHIRQGQEYLSRCHGVWTTSTMYRLRPGYHSHFMGYIVPLLTGVVLKVQCTVRIWAARCRRSVTNWPDMRYFSHGTAVLFPRATMKCSAGANTLYLMPWT